MTAHPAPGERRRTLDLEAIALLLPELFPDRRRLGVPTQGAGTDVGQSEGDKQRGEQRDHGRRDHRHDRAQGGRPQHARDGRAEHKPEVRRDGHLPIARPAVVFVGDVCHVGVGNRHVATSQAVEGPGRDEDDQGQRHHERAARGRAHAKQLGLGQRERGEKDEPGDECAALAQQKDLATPVAV